MSTSSRARSTRGWRRETARLLDAGKIVGIVGGDHSVPYGALKAVAARRPSFGVLHFDAHSDTRRAYEGFVHSHASIMFNVLEDIPQVTKLVQVGIRDLCEEEHAYCKSQGARVRMFSDRELVKRRHAGEPFARTVEAIVQQLPDEVWVSFDIDGLDPRFCPHTGTPVPGGLDTSEVVAILREVARSGRRIVGFDLNEVAPSAHDDDRRVGRQRRRADALQADRLHPREPGPREAPRLSLPRFETLTRSRRSSTARMPRARPIPSEPVFAISPTVTCLAARSTRRCPSRPSGTPASKSSASADAQRHHVLTGRAATYIMYT